MSTWVVFTDGASSGNPGPGGWGVIIVYPMDETQQVQELGGGDPRTTNNRMELTGAIEGLRGVAAISNKLTASATIPVRVHTDSTYVIRGITQWIHGWKRNGWKTAEGEDVLNRDLWCALEERVLELRKLGASVEWTYVPGHAGVAGNDRADEIAVQFSRGEVAKLFQGPLSSYGLRVLEIPANGSRESKREAPYYLSLVDGVLEKHATWAECEARVKGKSGARYKKVQSASEEQETLRSWGVS